MAKVGSRKGGCGAQFLKYLKNNAFLPFFLRLALFRCTLNPPVVQQFATPIRRDVQGLSC